ncbi:MAG: hypothetical protein NTX25_23415 [Proteobacteria bacterium]|nr:hypothetical protein [Pseudomonadota bacterium]
MRIAIISAFLYQLIFCDYASASDLDDIKKIVAIQSAEIARLKKEIADSNVKIDKKIKNLSVVFEPLNESTVNDTSSLIMNESIGANNLSRVDCNHQKSVVMAIRLFRNPGSDGPYFDRATCAKLKIVTDE